MCLSSRAPFIKGEAGGRARYDLRHPVWLQDMWTEGFSSAQSCSLNSALPFASSPRVHVVLVIRPRFPLVCESVTCSSSQNHMGHIPPDHLLLIYVRRMKRASLAFLICTFQFVGGAEAGRLIFHPIHTSAHLRF